MYCFQPEPVITFYFSDWPTWLYSITFLYSPHHDKPQTLLTNVFQSELDSAVRPLVLPSIRSVLRSLKFCLRRSCQITFFKSHLKAFSELIAFISFKVKQPNLFYKVPHDSSTEPFCWISALISDFIHLCLIIGFSLSGKVTGQCRVQFTLTSPKLHIDLESLLK